MAGRARSTSTLAGRQTLRRVTAGPRRESPSTHADPLSVSTLIGKDLVDAACLADLAKSDAMTVQDILHEARAGLSDGGTVRLSVDEEGDSRYVSIGDDLAQSDGASCYFIHELSSASPSRQ